VGGFFYRLVRQPITMLLIWLTISCILISSLYAVRNSGWEFFIFFIPTVIGFIIHLGVISRLVDIFEQENNLFAKKLVYAANAFLLLYVLFKPAVGDSEIGMFFGLIELPISQTFPSMLWFILPFSLCVLFAFLWLATMIKGLFIARSSRSRKLPA